MLLITIFLAGLFCYSLVSARLERTMLTAAIVFTIAGIITFILLPRALDPNVTLPVFLQLAEVGLVLLLFSDASRTDLGILREIGSLPARLLSTGMLLTILLGGFAALVVFRQLTLWEAGILAAILAPTDAGLGQLIVTSGRVPMKIRQALNVEAGLNDGLSVPFLLFFIALAGIGQGGRNAGLHQFILEQLGLGALIGLIVGTGGGFLIRFAQDRKWISHSFEQLSVVVLPLLCMLASEFLAASMFIAAFVAGLFIQLRFREARKHSIEFSEDWGQMLNLSVFFLFGLLIARDWHQFSVPSHLCRVESDYCPHVAGGDFAHWHKA